MTPRDSYRQISYLTIPMAQTHPDRLAAVATLFGMEPAPVTACRVLEVGCGSGGNLIPMAHFLPGSRFTGVDLAEDAIAEGRRAIDELGIPNLEFKAMDLREIGPAMGEFDYIIAHGVYSWVPDDVRDRLLTVCRERLAPQGVAYISYNALPGRHVRIMLREMMLYHTRGCSDPGQRIEGARALLRMVGEAQLVERSWRPMVEEEIERMLTGNAGWFFHDDLAAVNDSFYLRDFVARAARQSLQYLGDAEAHLMFYNEDRLAWLGDDVIERQQYLDFLYLRQFRMTLLCREEVPLQRQAGAERMDKFLFSSPARDLGGLIEGLNSVCIGAAQEGPARAAAAMREVYPLPVAFERLCDSAGDREELRRILFKLISSGFAQFHVHDFAPGTAVTLRPRASRLACWEAARTGEVTYSTHRVLSLDDIVRQLLKLLDGTREFDDIASALARVEGAPSIEDIRGYLPEILAHMARTGLLL